MQVPSPLRVDHVSKVFEPSLFWSGTQSRFTAVDDLSFSLAPGEILGVLGPNGAGKTTTIHMLLGVTQPTAGNISYFGKDLLTHRSSIMKQVTFASTYIRLLGRLTLYENLSFYAELYALSRIEALTRIDTLLRNFDLWRVKDRQAAALSAGEMARALLIKAFLPHPKIVLLDEPTAALDPDVAYAVREFILKQRKEYGVSMLFTSHNMAEVAHMCDRVLVLQAGKAVALDTPETLAASASMTRVRLTTDVYDKAFAFAKEHGYRCTRTDHGVEFESKEQQVPHLLQGLMKAGVSYSAIAIDEPSLEQYFLELAYASNGGTS